MRDTIFAPATAAGRAAVAVMRMSGPEASAIAGALCGRLPSARRATLRHLKWNGSTLDEALVLWMPGPASFTGEDCVEFHIHGGSAVVEGLTAALTGAGARLADAGEFTRRAFEAGRLDLTQAEAMADLVDAETEAQRRQALAQMSGALSDRYKLWREKLLDALAMIEAGIDFPEDDVPDGVVSGATPLIDAVRTEIGAELAGIRGERVRDGFRIAVVGAPNVGKSSILNALVGRDAAIVTPMAGTTRDVIEAQLVLSGQVVHVADTAGLRDAGDAIEAEGIRRARAWADDADIRVAVGDASRPSTVELAQALLRDGDILVVNKTDLDHDDCNSFVAIRTAAVTGEVDALRQALRSRVTDLSVGRDFPAITRQRHRALLTDCLGDLDRSTQSAKGAELIGEDLRLAIRALERIAGRIDPESVLDRVFATFCIGK